MVEKRGLLVIGSALLLFALLAGCLGGGGPSEETGATPSTAPITGGGVDTGGLTTTKTGLTFTDPEMQEIYEAALQPDPLPATTDKISDAFEKNAITQEQYILYTLQVYYEPGEVPAEYAGEKPETDDLTDEVMLAIEN
ncbi:MAG: hypothetical protein V1834_02665, partial [Candidatus Micrarchaeota archaeon]